MEARARPHRLHGKVKKRTGGGSFNVRKKGIYRYQHGEQQKGNMRDDKTPKRESREIIEKIIGTKMGEIHDGTGQEGGGADRVAYKRT